MRRKLIQLAAGASLLVALAAAAVWAGAAVLAGNGRNWIVQTDPDGSHWIVGVAGSGWVYVGETFPHPQGPAFRGPINRRPRSQVTWSLDAVPGIVAEQWHMPEPLANGTVLWHPTNRSTQVHLAWPLLLGSILPAGLWARRRRLARRARRRSARGLCPACGYDLRGTPAPARCPECGHPAEHAHPPPATGVSVRARA